MPEQTTEEQVLEAVLDLVANYDAATVIKALASACRVAEEVAKEQEYWTESETLAHYASSLEELVQP